MKQNVRPDSMAMIVRISVVATTIHRAMLKLEYVFVTKDGAVMIALSLVEMDTMV